MPLISLIFLTAFSSSAWFLVKVIAFKLYCPVLLATNIMLGIFEISMPICVASPFADILSSAVVLNPSLFQFITVSLTIMPLLFNLQMRSKAVLLGIFNSVEIFVTEISFDSILKIWISIAFKDLRVFFDFTLVSVGHPRLFMAFILILILYILN